ncbi:MAG TPA: ferritin-like domain-containing protein [Bacteroidia bacterium]|nr:ferritin-like domain-containing protein [Bacteroidia bacterium]
MKNIKKGLSQNKVKKQSKESTKKTKTNAAQDLRHLFIEELKDIYWAEKALTKAIPKMIKNAASKELVEALMEHLEVTEGQVKRLEKVFGLVGEKAVAKKCEAMAGLIQEAEEIIKETELGPVRDAGIILAGQKVEHYEIATYGTLSSFAKTLGEHDAVAFLKESLSEEKEADEVLSDIAESSINVDANDEDVNDKGIRMMEREKVGELNSVDF